jgi:hypothetical protein
MPLTPLQPLTVDLTPLEGLRPLGVPAAKIAAAPSEYANDPNNRKLRQNPAEQSFVDKLIEAPLSALGYIGSQLDAIMGRRIRAGIQIVKGQAKPGTISELFTVPVVSDLIGWTNRNNTVTGKEIIDWDDDDTIWDGAAGFAAEMLTDPLSFTPGVILGALGKGGRVVKSAKAMPAVAKALSRRMGRKVGVREASLIATMKDAVQFTAGTTNPSLMSSAMRKRWDEAARGQGYKDIGEALGDWGSHALGGRIGLTWNPLGEARLTYGTGKFAQKVARLQDAAGEYLAATGPVRTLGKMFDRTTRGADTAQMQARFREMDDELTRQQYAVRLKNNERHADLTLLGLDEPQYRDMVIASLNKAVKKSRKTGDQDWYLHPDERDIDAIMQHTMEASKHPHAAAMKQWAGYRPLRDFIEGVWRDTADNLRQFEELGLGDKAYSGTREAYFHRATQPIADPKFYKRKPPTRITADMRRVLKGKGLVDADIDKLTPEEALQKAYGTKITDADRMRWEQVRQGELQSGLPPAAKSLSNSDRTEIGRLDFLTGIRNGGTSWLASAPMDTRLSGPLADYANARPAATRIIYQEAMQGDASLFDFMVEETAKRMAQAGAPGEIDRPFQPGQLWGDLAGKPEIGVGKRAQDSLTSGEARKLNDWWTIERQAFEQSGQIADWLRGLDPRHAFHQVPLFKADPTLLQMEFELATGRTLAHAKAGLRAAGDAIDSTLTTHEQGPTVLDALQNGGYEARAIPRLKAFLRQNVNEFGQDAEFARRARKDLALLEAENPHEMRLAKKKGGQRIITSGGEEFVDPKWFKFEVDRASVLYQYGQKAPKLFRRKSGNRLYQMFKSRAEQLAARQSAKMPGAPVFLREQDYVDLLRKAEAANIKVSRKTARQVARQVAYDQFVKQGGEQKVFRVPHDFASDLTKSMSYTRDPDVTRGFWAGWDKITNLSKSLLTAQHIGFAARNAQGLGLMDFVFGAGTRGGVNEMLSPKRMVKFVQRWKRSYDFHAGQDIKNAHKLPIFADTDWAAVAKRYGDLSGKPVVDDAAFRQKAATDMLRSMAAASQIADAHKVGAPIADLLNVAPGSVSAIGEMIPGQGRNIQSPWIGLQAAGRSVREFFGKLASGRFRDIDWGFLKPWRVRGVGGNPAEMRSAFLPAGVGESVNQYIENVGRTASWLGFLDEGMDPLEAAIRSNAMHVDYSDVTNFERKVMKRLVPFYSYTRRMTQFFLRDLAQHPGGLTANMVRAVNNSTGEGRNNEIVPQQLVGQMAIPLYKDGKVKAFLRPDIPVNVINQLFTIGPDAYSTFQNTGLGWLGMAHFFPKGLLETAFGKSTFQKGRNLEDLYSRIGVKDPLTNQIIMSSPISRYLTQFGPRGVLFDERKSLTEKAMSLVAGMPVQQIDMERAANEVVDEAIRRSLRTAEGVRRSERFYIAAPEEADERSKALIEYQNSRARSASKARRDAEKARKAAEAEAAGLFNVPTPTMLPTAR